MITVSLEELIQRVSRCHATRAVTDELSRHRIDPASYVPFVFFTPDQYTRNVVHRTPQLEIALLCWLPGQMSAVHDHGGALGWTVMLEGELTTWKHEVIAPNGAPPQNVVRMCRLESGETLAECGPPETAHAGTLATFDGPNEIHKVGNVSPSGVRAISLNLYTPPITTYRVYDLDIGTVKMHQACSYSEFGKIL